MPVGTIVRKCHIWTELFHARSATGALMVGCNHASDTDDIALFESRYTGSNFCDLSNNLMPRDARISRRHQTVPLVARRVQIRMANATKEDVDMNISFGNVSAWNRCAGKCGGGT